MSTFELFLQLPLFKNVEMDELFSLIPKINLDFESVQPGSVVFNPKMEVKGLVYLLKGEVEVSSKEKRQTLRGPILLSYTGMFGSDRCFLTDVVAKETCNILNVDTKSLLFLLRTCPSFLSGYLALLSDTIGTLYAKNNDVIVI